MNNKQLDPSIEYDADGNVIGYKHDSGLSFDIGLVAGHDITVIMLYAVPEPDEPFGPYDEGFWLVDYVWGSPNDQDDRDYKYNVDHWLADKSEDFISTVLRRQTAQRKEYEQWLADKQSEQTDPFVNYYLEQSMLTAQLVWPDQTIMYIFIVPDMIFVADCDWSELSRRIGTDDFDNYEAYDMTDNNNYYRRSKYADYIDSALLYIASRMF